MRGSSRRIGQLGTSILCLAIAVGPVHASETQTYTYDELGRLVSVAHSGTINSTLKTTYCYDPASNRTQYKSDLTGGAVACSTSGPASLAISGASVTEGGSLVFTVTRSGNTAIAVTASYATSSGTAISGSDFSAASGVVSFAANQATATITVATIDDTAVESAETMSVTLSAPSSGAAIATATGTGTIIDNDVAPADLAIGNASVTEGGALVFTVTRSGNTATATSASYATASGTAISGSDFAAGSGTVSFAANQATATVTVPTIDDTAIESAETMTVTLSAPSSGTTISAAIGTGTIIDNDSASPTNLVISDASAIEASYLTFTVTRSGNTAVSTSVNYATATAGTGSGFAAANDFVATSGTLTFAPGETSKTISVFANTDIRIEVDEVFFVNLSSPTGGAILNDAQGVGTIFDDGNGGGGGGVCATC
jgi:Calx-beta domain